MHISLFYKQFLGKGGFPREWRRFVIELAKLGEDITIYCYEGSESIEPLDNIHLNIFVGNARDSFKLPRGLRDDIEKNKDKVDVFEIVGGFVPENVALMKMLNKLKIPYIVAPLGQLAPKVVNRDWWKKLPFLYLFLIPVLKKAAAIHTFSPLETTWTRKWVDRPIIEATHGSHREDIPKELDSNYLRKSFPFIGKRRILLFLGRLDIYWKGLDSLVQGFQLATTSMDDIALLIIGPDQDNNKKFLEEEIHRLKLQESAYILEPIYGDDKYNTISSADIFICPSNFDILPRAVREALTVGCPVIVSHETQFGHFVKKFHAGTVCDVNAQSIADAIVEVFTNEGHATTMRDNARNLATDALNWKIEATKLRDGIKNILNIREK